MTSSRKALSAMSTEPARITAIANQKGGVGKTTTAVNLGTTLAAIGQRVLVLDLDPQGNASTSLGLSRAERKRGSYDLLLGTADLGGVTVSTRVPNLAVVPATVDLSGADIELVDVERREHCLKDALAEAALPYDFILIDCPPSLTLLTVNALVAADRVIVPLQCEFLALEGVSHLIRTMELVKKRFNPGLDLDGVLLTMYDRRNNLSDMVADDVRSHFGRRVFDTVIPRNVRISEAPSHGLPVVLYDHRSSGARAYMDLATEVMTRAGRPLPPAPTGAASASAA